MPYHFPMKVIGIAGYSGSGKTTLIEKLVPVLVREGLRVSLVKHAHHEFDVDQPGKDSYRHRHAGCTEVLVSSSRRWALMHELRGAAEPSLSEQLRHLAPYPRCRGCAHGRTAGRWPQVAVLCRAAA